MVATLIKYRKFSCVSRRGYRSRQIRIENCVFWGDSKNAILGEAYARHLLHACNAPKVKLIAIQKHWIGNVFLNDNVVVATPIVQDALQISKMLYQEYSVPLQCHPKSNNTV